MHFHPSCLPFPSCYSSHHTNGRQLGMRSFIVYGRGSLTSNWPMWKRTVKSNGVPWAVSGADRRDRGPTDIKVSCTPMPSPPTLAQQLERASLGHHYMLIFILGIRQLDFYTNPHVKHQVFSIKKLQQTWKVPGFTGDAIRWIGFETSLRMRA